MMKKIVLLLLLPLCSFARDLQYPQGYFRNPLNIPIVLAGNFGECRPNHFHSGLDIKTLGKENLPVFAAADGYISRIKMEKGGFGHALYVTHPNGFTTVYAHLNDFVPAVQRYLKQQQYKKQSWAVDLQLPAEMFPVKKGEQIAWSGNTGGSTAPHLHFEIRDSRTEHPVNPMLFGFSIPDSRPPVPVRLSFYDVRKSIYEQESQVISLVKQGNTYTVSDTILMRSDKVGIGLEVNDFMDGSSNTLNFYTASWYLDDSLQGTIVLDDIGYDVTRYLHAYVDYREHKQKSRWFQLLFRLRENQLSHLYPFLNAERGALELEEDKTHKVRIVLHDATGNETTITFPIRSRNADANNQECTQLFRAGSVNRFEHTNVQFALGERALYDDICFRFNVQRDELSFSDKYQIHHPYVPVHSSFKLNLKPNKPVSFSLRDKLALVYSDGKSERAQAADFENGWYKASVRNFGTYRLVADTIAPIITSLQKQNALLGNASQLRFRVSEDRTSVKTFRAELDGKWICFEPRGDIFFYTFDEHCPKGKHRLKITVTDENGNIQTLVYNFTR